MTPSAVERRIRAGLPVIRFLQTRLPLRWIRQPLRGATARARLPADITRQAVSADGVPCEWLIPHNSPPDQALVYLHGGGFVYGVTPQHITMVAHLVRQMGIRALIVDYRLAPEHPFPAALDDCTTAYRWLLNQGLAPHNTVLAGDSAGGNLTLTTMMTLRAGGEPLPAAAACLSPVADLSARHSPGQFRDPLLPLSAVRSWAAARPETRKRTRGNDHETTSVSTAPGFLAGAERRRVVSRLHRSAGTGADRHAYGGAAKRGQLRRAQAR